MGPVGFLTRPSLDMQWVVGLGLKLWSFLKVENCMVNWRLAQRAAS